MQTPQVRDVPVVHIDPLGKVLVFEPLLQLPLAADLIRRDLLAHFIELGGKLRIDPKDFR